MADEKPSRRRAVLHRLRPRLDPAAGRLRPRPGGAAGGGPAPRRRTGRPAPHLRRGRERQARRPPAAPRGARGVPRRGAVLVIAKLDRLARSVALISRLMESGVEFVACDMPEANRFVLLVLAAVAEHERAMISERTGPGRRSPPRGRGASGWGRRPAPTRRRRGPGARAWLAPGSRRSGRNSRGKRGKGSHCAGPRRR